MDTDLTADDAEIAKRFNHETYKPHESSEGGAPRRPNLQPRMDTDGHGFNRKERKERKDLQTAKYAEHAKTFLTR
jgi:hypothetical protein